MQFKGHGSKFLMLSILSDLQYYMNIDLKLVFNLFMTSALNVSFPSLDIQSELFEVSIKL